MVQNFAHFQQYCHPCAGGNYFAESEPVPRSEAACASCAQKDYLEHRYKLRLVADIPNASAIDASVEEEEDNDDEIENQQSGK